MIGLLYLAAFWVYIGTSVFVVWFFVHQAKKRGIAGWKWGVPAAIVMYLLVFWDHVPTLLAHKYYCERDAGFTVAKTLDEWKAENPGVAETLVAKSHPDSSTEGSMTTYHLNERFDWRLDTQRVFLSVLRRHDWIVDTKTHELVAEYIDYESGWGNLMVGVNEFRGYKIWLVNGSCEKDSQMPVRKTFYTFKKELSEPGRKQK
jgi:hypothetical protein